MKIASNARKSTSPESMLRIRRYAQILSMLALILAIAVLMDNWFRDEIGIAKQFADAVANQWGTGSLIAGALLYILLLSMPFVPGVELGILLMCVFGKEGIAFVYLATVIGLNISFIAGRKLPQHWVLSQLEKINIVNSADRRSREIQRAMKRITTDSGKNNKGIVPFLAKHRYLTIGVLFNIPGNYLIGGGGGISLACGLSGIVKWRWYFLTVAIAVAPVPLLVWFGYIQLETFLGVK